MVTCNCHLESSQCVITEWKLQLRTHKYQKQQRHVLSDVCGSYSFSVSVSLSHIWHNEVTAQNKPYCSVCSVCSWPHHFTQSHISRSLARLDNMGISLGPIKVNYLELEDGRSVHEADLYMSPAFCGWVRRPGYTYAHLLHFIPLDQ